jgi:hypothetical protein
VIAEIAANDAEPSGSAKGDALGANAHCPRANAGDGVTEI